MGGDTGNSNQNSTGHFFEEIVESAFLGLYRSKGEKVPDFKGNGFWLEAKVGYKKNGPHIHEFQLNPRWLGTVYYIFGYHNLDNTGERMKNIKEDEERELYLLNFMNITEVYFFPLEIVQKIYDKDKKKGPNGRKYDMVLNQSIPKNIINGNNFKRKGKNVTAPEYYNFNPAEFDSGYFDGIPFKCSYLVKKSDKFFLNFLEQNGILSIK